MNILEKIVIHKRREVALNKDSTPISELENSNFFQRKSFSIRQTLMRPQSSGIIAEFKRQSPSKGIINDQVKVEEVTTAYAEAGASAISILTDTNFFGGSTEDFIQAREINSIPLLRKDFIIDEYQIVEAKSMGADLILLIAAILTPKEVRDFAAFAHSLGMEVLLEVHNKEELELTATPEVDLIGVNNRNLKDFTLDLNTSLELAELIPKEFIKISESGISDPETIVMLKKVGFKGFLVGENFMSQPDPGAACEDFIARLKGMC